MTTRSNHYSLSVAFATSGTVHKGDVVELLSAMTCRVPTGAGSKKILGTVEDVKNGVATVATKFREMRTDRVAGSSGCVVGPFVFGIGGVVDAYDDSINISSLTISGSSAFSFFCCLF